MLILENPLVYTLLGVHCLFGALGAIIAVGKGYRLGRWLLYGLIGGTVTLVGSIVMPQYKE